MSYPYNYKQRCDVSNQRQIIADQKMTIKKLEAKLAKLQQEFDRYKMESVKWSVEDFTYRAKDIGYKITKAQAQEALERMIYKHDAELGINWFTIDCYIEEYGTEKLKKAK